MKTKVIKYTGFIFLFVAVMLSCRKDPGDTRPAAETESIQSMHQLKASDDFNWKTMQDVEVDIYITSASLLVIKSIDGIIYHKAMTKGGVQYTTKVTLPTYEKEVYVTASGQSRLMPIHSLRLTGTF